MVNASRLHPSVRGRLERLSPDQRAAATAPRGPVLCVAPAGSGKTTTLVARISWLVAGGQSPAEICALTFNRRAAEELAARVDEALAPMGLAPGSVRISTFHAIGREILRTAGVDVRRLVDRADVLRHLLGAGAPAEVFRRLDDWLSRRKLDPDAAGPPDPGLEALFDRYEKQLADQCGLDFDDLVARSLSLLRADPAALITWRRACRWLLVDEVQDLDRSQLELALLLAGEAADLFLVGDDDQTIYAWRLADVRRVLGLAARLAGLRRFDLITNRRCPPEVVRRASRLVAHNRERFAKRIEAAPSASGFLRLAADPGDDAARARRLIGAWLTAEEGSHAILARTNAALAPYEAVVLENRISYRVAEDALLLDDPAVDSMLAETYALGSRNPDALFLACLARVARSRSGHEATVGSSLLGWAAPYPSADALREAIDAARAARAGLLDDNASLVLATSHATKGLEWDHVACVGLDEGVFPSARSLAEASDPARALEEERRLAYVAWTRARRSLTLVFDPYAPSVFMREAFDPAEIAP